MSKEELSKQYADKKTSESPRNAYRFLLIEKQKELTCFDGYEIEVAYEDGFDKAVEEIRKEVERRLDELNPKKGMLGNKPLRDMNPKTFQRERELEKILSFIDSLQKGTKCI